MAAFDDAGVLDKQYVEHLQQEQPSIYSSVKNLCAFALGSNIQIESSTTQQGTSIRNISSSTVMSLVKVLLQNFSSYDLPSVEEYSTTYPQDEAQSGIDRLEEIGQYKAVYHLRVMAVKRGGKISRLFGKSYILWSRSWPEIRKRTLEAFLKTIPQGGNQEILLGDANHLLDIYEASLELSDRNPENQLQSLASAVIDKYSSSHSKTNADLIWAVDFNEALQRRQQVRKKAVEDRLTAMNAEEAEEAAEVDAASSIISPSERVVELVEDTDT